jgi:ribosomal protein S12 methylthiotransferase accessory factor
MDGLQQQHSRDGLVALNSPCVVLVLRYTLRSNPEAVLRDEDRRTLSLLRKTGLGVEEEMPVITDEPRLPSYLCFPSDDALACYFTQDLVGQGSDQNRDLAKLKAYAELIERLCLKNIAGKQLVNGAYLQLLRSLPVIDPVVFDCYAPSQHTDQKAHHASLRNEPYSWCIASQLAPTVREVLIPAKLVYLTHELTGEYAIRREGISTGAAVGPQDSGHVLCAGLFECIERDASIGAWLGLNPARVIEPPDDSSKSLSSYISRYYLETFLLDVTSDLGIPTCLAFCLDRTGLGPALTSGARSDFTIEAAAFGALKEAIQARRPARFMSLLRSPFQEATQTNIRGLFDRFSFWSKLENLPLFESWYATSCFKGKVSQRQCVIAKNAESLCSALANRGFTIFTVDISLPELGRHGLKCQKIIVPELHALYLDESAKSLYSPHYGRVPNDDCVIPHPIT